MSDGLMWAILIISFGLVNHIFDSMGKISFSIAGEHLTRRLRSASTLVIEPPLLAVHSRALWRLEIAFSIIGGRNLDSRRLSCPSEFSSSILEIQLVSHPIRGSVGAQAAAPPGDWLF